MDFKPVIKLWTEGAHSQKSQKSMKAFQDLTAKKMSRFVTLCALTRLQCRTPSQHPNASDGTWQEARRLHLTGQAVSKPALRMWGSAQRSRDKPRHHGGCQACQQAASLLPWLYFWGFIMKINTLSKLLALCHILFNWTEPLQRPLIRVRPVYWFANISGCYMMKLPP